MAEAMKRSGPLAGMRVIELAHIMAGPVCGLMLADMGAEVIKVEKMDGDDTRRTVPPALEGESAAYMMMNRGKRGISLDLKDPDGVAVLRRLLKGADALIENYRGGTMERLGIGYETLREEFPALVYCSLSGFGRTGPYAERAGFDLVAQGMSGLMSITGEGPGRPPMKCGPPVTDITAGILAAMGVLAAYSNRLRTGKGQAVDTSLFEAGITHTYWQSAIAMATGIAPGPMGSAHPLNAPYEAFETADGWITIGAANQTNWLRLLKAIGAEALADDPRFAVNRDRMINRQDLAGTLAPIFRAHSSAEWLARLEAGGVPAGPVLDVNAMHRDPQALAREMVVEVEHPRVGRMKTLGLPVKFSETPGRVHGPAPLLGEHSRAILAEAGYASAEIDALIARGVVRETAA
ncbi:MULTISPECIES: CoA transferase [Methylobacterium]|uniref:Crotonobetainyl-CoA:carnitine CoA-transferase CaiB-like acyl-CoA transferase n=1 Tax=Methylobacterium fujisawaense TaxID=107400 RepID=A0ABR6D7C1_9HYPH|nr:MULTISPECIES: CoA transferase [Methylobacterium]MBA9061991.1 crotonobetainyl-CoA:carnitine CoA-transferase CaiB-like acyl-CoA transferase [Methylobacterium fujisawaense]MDH3028014.1 CoA transferase [Methylobacterium fujisawaense]SFU77546.1 Crotonobetainyl-CoA:carnitine CoA-transferase CaiB [Methylobacterium sp. UNCCL125]